MSEAFEKHIADCIESEVGLSQALAKDETGNYTTRWVCNRWHAWQAATAIPSGYVLMPEVPTVAMLDAGMYALEGNYTHAEIIAAYAAMLQEAKKGKT